jgi:DNA-binding transcriptional LysR family regulator
MKRINVTLDEIQAFVAVARSGSFKSAADSLYISQPALSRRIDNLEQTLQARLLERTTRRVALTPQGHNFLGRAVTGLEALQAGASEVANETARLATRITVACVPTLANHVLPQVMAGFSRSHPQLRLRMLDEGTAEVLQAVQSGEADFGVSFLGTQSPDIEFHALMTEDYVLAVRPDHPLARRASVAWRDLADEKMVSVSGSSGNRILIDHALSRLKQRPTVHFEANHVAGALGLVEAGLGVAVVPRLALSLKPDASVLGLTLHHPKIERTLGLIVRKGRRLRPVCTELVNALKQELKALGGPLRKVGAK